jgi:aerobic-type carbon monoxide dehydrogenase small subunit (CoxS/CutS family)
MDSFADKTATFFQLNGEMVTSYPETGVRLSRMLREEFGARDVKIGCNAGDCGACTVLVDGDPICACLMPAHQVEGRSVETLSGLYKSDTKAKDLAERFQDHGAAQCGICTPGMMVSAVALLRENAKPNVKRCKMRLLACCVVARAIAR